MRTRLSAVALGVLPLLAAWTAAPPLRAATAESWEKDKAAKLGHWRTQMGLAEPVSERLVLDRTSAARGEIHRFANTDPITSLSLTARIDLRADDSLARVILVDAAGREHLVYEVYPLLVEGRSVRVEDACEETCLLDPVAPQALRLDLVDATVSVEEVRLVRAAGPSLETPSLRKAIKKAQHDAKLERLREAIASRKLAWRAGETTISPWMHEEKRRLFMGGVVPNLQGAEYYRGGVFTIGRPGADAAAATADAGLVDAFDWRSRHGANDPGSPYYDGDPLGSGWMTSVKNQLGCGSCWAFAATGATEALANLYFNEHLDLDLSEQDALSCSGAGSCGGGWPGMTLDYYTQVGVVDEACFPYVAWDQPCEKCPSPQELVQIAGQVPFPRSWPPTETDLKTMILDYGPLSGGIYSWGHAMALVGYRRDADGLTVWIFKNSWGDWGENGYAYVRVPMDDIGWTHALLQPVSATTSYGISCRDEDRDGFYNWGLSPDAPLSCPPQSALEKDCDDSNGRIGPFDRGGRCSKAVHVDVKPGSCPNKLNRKQKGHLQVAIAGTKGFSVKRIDPSSVRLEGVAPTCRTYKDVARPYDPATGKTRARQCTDARRDGRVDLLLKFDNRAIGRALANAEKGDVVPVRLRARLKASHGGGLLVGEDVLLIVK
jgi:hypothetical protein